MSEMSKTSKKLIVFTINAELYLQNVRPIKPWKQLNRCLVKCGQRLGLVWLGVGLHVEWVNDWQSVYGWANAILYTKCNSHQMHSNARHFSHFTNKGLVDTRPDVQTYDSSLTHDTPRTPTAAGLRPRTAAPNQYRLTATTNALGLKIITI